DLRAGRLLELLRVRAPDLFVRLDEAAPAEQAELRVLLDREHRRVLCGRGLRERSGRGTRCETQAPLHETAAQRHGGTSAGAAIFVRARARSPNGLPPPPSPANPPQPS